MLTLESQHLTGSDRRISSTRNYALLLKIKQDEKVVKWVLLNDFTIIIV